jgi:hypothetical protein
MLKVDAGRVVCELQESGRVVANGRRGVAGFLVRAALLFLPSRS